MKNIKGMTFVEILIAVMLFAIVLLSLLTGLQITNETARSDSNKTMALNYAKDLIEEIKGVPYEDEDADVPNYHSYPYTNYLGPEYNTVDFDEEDDDTDDSGVVLNTEFNDVDDYNGYTDQVSLPQGGGVFVTATRTVEVMGLHYDDVSEVETNVDEDNNDTIELSEFNNISYKRVIITISWNWADRAYSQVLDTIISYYE